MNRAGFALTMVLLVGPSPAPDAPIDCRKIRDALLSVAREYENGHVVLAKRGDSASLLNRPPEPPPIQFFDAWMVGDAVQVLQTMGEAGAVDPWWRGYSPRTAPVNVADAAESGGRTTLARKAGEILHADFIILPEGRRAQYPSVYSTSKTLLPVAPLFVPLLEIERGWSEATNRGEWPVVNEVALTPIEKWRPLGREKLNGVAVAKVEVERSAPFDFALKRHKSPLTMIQVYHCWFAEEIGHQPVRIESSVRYRYDGKDYPYQRAAGKEPLIVYEAGQFQRSGDGPWFPMSGSQRGYTGAPGETPPFDPDRIADELEAKGKYVDDDPYVLNTSREWRVLKLEKIPRSTRVWFEAPRDSRIRSLEAK